MTFWNITVNIKMNGNMVNGITLRVTMARRQNYTPKTFHYTDNRSGARGSNAWSDLGNAKSCRISGRKRNVFIFSCQ